MTALTKFLLARFAEDEADARLAIASSALAERAHESGCRFRWSWAWTVDGARGVATYSTRHDPARVLADVEAKRRIVEWVVGAQAAAGDPPGFDLEDAETLTHCLRLLALPYADHPSYDESWRP